MPGGVLLVSGVVSARESGIVLVVEKSGFDHVESIAHKDWVGMVFCKNH